MTEEDLIQASREKNYDARSSGNFLNITYNGDCLSYRFFCVDFLSLDKIKNVLNLQAFFKKK
ncbi:MAG: hypothetical protein LBM95_03675 [Lactobacillales bacterium]|nr:hypothetical protein [Lactobacillales bacterium]